LTPETVTKLGGNGFEIVVEQIVVPLGKAA